MVGALVAMFDGLRLTSRQSALALPEGSVRALIALALILIFVVIGVYVVSAVLTGDAQQNSAAALLGTVGTLVVAVAGFYFGTNSVTTAAGVVRDISGGPDGPEAVTKGARTLDGGGTELVGVVNPRGRPTQYYFEYGESTTYGTATAPRTLPAGDAAVEVSSGRISELQKNWHHRAVAFNDAGVSYGRDSEIGGT